MSKITGWAGKILRVNLTEGSLKIEDTMKYKDYIGGMGIGYKVMWDEVPAGTKAFDEANKIILAGGPLVGTGAVCAGRTNITSLLAQNPYNAVSDSHMGGHFSAEMKYAGWDAIIVEGKSPKPVWLKIENDKVTLEDARYLWGKGIFLTTAYICGKMPKGAQVAAIGQAGENMVNLSVIMNNGSHSAGGHGGVLGSKNLKAIGIRGTLPIHIAADKSDWLEVDKEMMAVIGANNNHVVPSTPQPWAEYNAARSRWTATDGLYWGAANPPVNTGTCEPHDINSVGLRTMKATFDHGAVAEKYTVRMGGCHSCPIRCMSTLHIPQLEKYGVSPNVSNTCAGYSAPGGIMIKGHSKEGEEGEGTMISKTLGAQLADDYGVWCNYSQIGRDFKYAYEKGILKEVLPDEEYNSIPWDLLEKGDPEFLVDFYRRIAFKEGELSRLGEGAYWVAKAWNLGDDYWDNYSNNLWSRLGFPKHHANETAGQVGALINSMFNRDAQSHTLVNFTGSGLPINVQKEIIAEVIGSPDALDAPSDYKPMNQYKAKFAKWSIIRNCLHDSLTLCNWMWPMTASPLKERGYRGNTSLESKYFSMATGIPTTEDELDTMGERIFTLHRALTIKQMGTSDMRNKHDVICDWVYTMDPDKEPFTQGTVKLDRKDMEQAFTVFYKEMGWDEATGAPTKATLNRLGLGYVAVELEKLGLLPK